jgi:parallel beta-helix repeat protein
VLVFDGNYQAFQVTKSGTAAAPIVIMAQGSGATITSSGSSGDGVLLSNVSYVTLQGFKIQNSTRRCISGSNSSPTSPMKGLIVRGNTCTNAGHEGIYLSEVSSSLVEGNTVTNPGQDGQDRGHGMYLANAGSDNTIIRGNTLTGMNASDSAGLHMNGDLSVGGDGIISGVVIEGNTIYNGRQNGISMDGVQNTTIQNNLIFGVSNNAVRGFLIDGAQGPANMRVINNTLIAGSGWAVKFSDDRGGHVVFNNILLTGSSSSGSLSVGSSSVVSDYNAVVNRFSRDDDSSVISLSSWQGGGDDTHSTVTTSTALFVNPSANNYHRKDGSPAADTGTATLGSISAPATDIEGAGRPLGSAYDMGAYETQAGGGSVPTAPRPPTNVRIIK